MAYKDGKSGGMMNTGKGLCSYSKNPMAPAATTSSRCGPGSNPDQQKADRLLQKAYKEEDSLRGKQGF